MNAFYLRLIMHPLIPVLTSRFALSGAGFVCGVSLAHILGPTNLGIYSYIVSTASILAVVLSLGADVPYNIHAARRPSATANFLRMAFGQALAVSLIVPLVWMAIRYLGAPAPGTSLLLLGVVFAMVLNQLSYSVSAGAQKQVQVNLILAALIVSQPLGVYALTRAGVGPIGSAVAAYVAVYVLAMTVSYFILIKRREDDFPYLSLFKSVTFEGRHNLLSTVSGIVRIRGPIIILSAYAPSSSVGVYLVAQTLTELLYLVPVSISTSILSLTSSGPALFRESLKYAATGVGITLGAVLFLSFLLDHLVPLLYGPEFIAVIGYGRIMLWGAVAFSVAKCLSSFLYKVGSGGIAARVELGSTVAFLVLAPLMIKTWGVQGAAWSFVITSWLPAIAYGAVIAIRIVSTGMGRRL